jgi:RNA-directed DNA polymerase
MSDQLPPSLPAPNADEPLKPATDYAGFFAAAEYVEMSAEEKDAFAKSLTEQQVVTDQLAAAATFADLAEPFRQAKGVAHLAAVLNAALRLDVIEHPGHKAKPITAKLLNYYAFHKGSTRYRTFAIPKKTRGEFREIKAPDYGLLRLQRLLLRCLTAAFTTCDDAAHGFVPGRSILTNAQPHAGRRFVLNLDLKDFFPNTSVQRVVTVLQLPPFALAKPVAHLVASLCCDQGSLPQGAPTSPLLTNVVCQRLDRRLRHLARQHRCTYTRYADDLTFSSNRPAFQEQFHQELNAILSAEGYAQNDKKQRLQTNRQRQEVTGVVVNERPNVPREYVRQIRAMLHNWEIKGYEAANATLRQQYSSSKAHARHNGKVPKLERVLAGKIAYLGMIRGHKDETYSAFISKLTLLIPKKENSIFDSLLEAWDKGGLVSALTLKKELL